MPEIQRMTRWCPIVSSLLHLPTIYNHLQIYTNALSGTLRKWRKSGENPEPGVCQAQAGQPSLKITFYSLTCTWVLTSKDSGSSHINPSMCVMWCPQFGRWEEGEEEKRASWGSFKHRLPAQLWGSKPDLGCHYHSVQVTSVLSLNRQPIIQWAINKRDRSP